MDGDTLWTALGLVLVIEGLMPFFSPGTWRQTMLQVLKLKDGQVRFVGLISIAAGLAIVWLLGR